MKIKRGRGKKHDFAICMHARQLHDMKNSLTNKEQVADTTTRRRVNAGEQYVHEGARGGVEI